jgi:hypothetical protein
MHPYRPLYLETAPRPAARRPRDLTPAYGVLIAVSAIQLASGAQIIAGALGLVGGITGLLSTWRSSWTTSSSSS